MTVSFRGVPESMSSPRRQWGSGDLCFLAFSLSGIRQFPRRVASGRGRLPLRGVMTPQPGSHGGLRSAISLVWRDAFYRRLTTSKSMIRRSQSSICGSAPAMTAFKKACHPRGGGGGAWDLCFLAVMSLRSSHKPLSFPLDGKGPKDQGRLNRTSARLSKRLTFRSRSDFQEVKRRAPLRESQAFSHSLPTFPARRPGLPAWAAKGCRRGGRVAFRIHGTLVGLARTKAIMADCAPPSPDVAETLLSGDCGSAPAMTF